MRRSTAAVCLSLLLRQNPQSDTGSNRPAKQEQTKKKRRHNIPLDKFFIIIYHFTKTCTKGVDTPFPLPQRICDIFTFHDSYDMFYMARITVL